MTGFLRREESGKDRCADAAINSKQKGNPISCHLAKLCVDNWQTKEVNHLVRPMRHF